ncbi:Hypothetical protein A7982_07270 [Minicystis rosea]|nr:Hypothetical protein A7982_07270 [Minicystis rosea]
MAVIDLAATTVTQVPLVRPAVRLALGEPGQVFATIEPIVSDVRVEVISGGTAVELNMPTQPAELVAYDRATKQLYLGDRGANPSPLQRYAAAPTEVGKSTRLKIDLTNAKDTLKGDIELFVCKELKEEAKK